MTTTVPDVMKIERTTVIRAPRSRVWQALTAAGDFSQWFAAVQGPFAPGKRLELTTKTPCEDGKPDFYLIVERMDPEHTFSWRWHPGGTDLEEDGSTLVEFRLEEVQDGTRVTVTETGFERISLERRTRAFGRNQAGWEVKLQALAEYAIQAN